VAVQPNGAVRSRLEALALEQERRHPGSRRMRAGNLHLTLAFLGAIDPENAGRVLQCLRQIDTPNFSWTLDRLGAFQRAGVLWAGGAHSTALQALALRVRAALDAVQISYDRTPFTGHVTLLRGLAKKKMPVGEGPFAPAIVWAIPAPVLLCSVQDAAGRAMYQVWQPQPPEAAARAAQ